RAGLPRVDRRLPGVLPRAGRAAGAAALGEVPGAAGPGAAPPAGDAGRVRVDQPQRAGASAGRGGGGRAPPRGRTGQGNVEAPTGRAVMPPGRISVDAEELGN